MSYVQALLQWPISQIQYQVWKSLSWTTTTLEIVHKHSKEPFTYKHNGGYEYAKTVLSVQGEYSEAQMLEFLEQELHAKKAIHWHLPLPGSSHKIIPFPTGNNVLVWFDTKSNTWSYKLGNSILDTPQGPSIQYYVLSSQNLFPTALPPLFALEIINHHLSNKGGAEAFIHYHHWFCKWYKLTFGKDKPTCSTNHAGQFFENLFGALTGTPWVEAAVKTKDYDPTYENNFKQILSKINSLPKPTSKLTKG